MGHCGTCFLIVLPSLRRLRVTPHEIILGRQSIPLAGARAAVETQRSGLFGRSVTTILTIESPDGQQLAYTFGGSFGSKGATSRNGSIMIRKAAARVNTAAARALAAIPGPQP